MRHERRALGRRDGGEVVASFYPLAWVTEQVAGDDVDGLQPRPRPGGEPHDLELSIEATADGSPRADLVVYLGGFQPAVDDGGRRHRRGRRPWTRARSSTCRPLDEHDQVTTATPTRTGSPTRTSGRTRERMALLGRGGRPRSWAVWTRPAPTATAPTPRTCADRARRPRPRRTPTGLTGCERDVVVVSHDAFGYLAKYGLHLEPIAGLSPDAEPTPAALAELGELIRDEGITTVFSERLASPAMAETLASDLGVDTAVLDPVEGLTDETADEDYLSLMRANLAALQEANGC